MQLQYPLELNWESELLFWAPFKDGPNESIPF